MNIHFISPYSYSLQIGTAINEIVATLPDDSWIVHCDQDTLKPPGFADRVKKVLDGGIAKNVVLTCMTNRIGIDTPARLDDMWEEDSISNHLQKAKYLWKHFGTKTEPTNIAPGYCMIFHKQHWIALGGFPGNSIRFDLWLTERSTAYLMRGIYIIHLYRWGHSKTKARNRYHHLLRPGAYLDQ